MTISYVLMQNLRRNRRRTALTAAAFALPMAIFVAALSFVATLGEISRANEKALRLAVHHKTTITNSLPEGQRRKIEGIDPERRRLTAVCGMRWFGGRVPNTQNTLTSLAADPDTFPQVFSDVGLTEADVETWNKDRQAAVIGTNVADSYDWSAGDRVTLGSTVPPYLSLEFRVVKIMTNKNRANFFFFRRDYLADSLDAVGQDGARCNVFWVKCNGVDAMRGLQSDIDALFANSPDETKSEDENAFGANFMQATGDIPGLMQNMAVVVVVVVALVAGNTMMMSLRERTREIAVFKAIGFSRARVFSIVLGESVMLALIGSVIGIVPASALLLAFPVRLMNLGPIATLEVSPAAVIGSLAIALAVGLAAGAWPAFAAQRLRTVDALRRVA